MEIWGVGSFQPYECQLNLDHYTAKLASSLFFYSPNFDLHSAYLRPLLNSFIPPQ